MVSALKTAQREIHAQCHKKGFQNVEQHTQWIESDIPTLSLEADVKSAGGWLKPSNPPQDVVDLHRHMEAVRIGTIFKHYCTCYSF